METYLILMVVFGGITLLTSWLPSVLRDLPLSLPIACIALGAAIGWSSLAPVLASNPLEDRHLTERLTEFVVIVALMGAGLKIDRRIGWRRWGLAWRLLGVSMPLTIAAIAFLGWSQLGLGVASAILLGACLAPTDPVLASDVQVGAPGEGEEDEVRFALTSEAGLNDGLAFPFVYLAVALATAQATGEPWLKDWVLVDVIWRLAAGTAVGWAAGWALGYFAFRLPGSSTLARTGDGFVALGITALTYGVAELVEGYGFIAVFVAAVVLRDAERDHEYHTELHDFTEQIERLLMMVLLVCFGAAIAEGSVFDAISWPVVGVTLLILFVVRPVSGMIGLIGVDRPLGEKAAISFFGIRGLGSFYYLAYALGAAEFAEDRTLWVTVSLVVLISIVFHGASVTSVMRHLDRSRRADAQRS